MDVREYELTFHLTVEHSLPPGQPGGSALIVHPPGQPGPSRLPLPPGHAAVIRGRGTLHSWEPLGDAERRVLTAVGFERAV